MSAQECTDALKVQEAWRCQKSHLSCTCTTTFYPDGDKMIPEKHVCLRCYEWMQKKKENAALKIQEAWREYQRSKDSCPICLQIIGEDSCQTKCGHRFCTGCLLKAVQRNSSCPLCRGELIKTDEVEDNAIRAEEYASSVDQANFEENSLDHMLFEQYNAGYDDARQDGEEDFQLRLREEIDIATQKAYDDGVVQGRTMANEEIRLLKEEIDRLKRSNSRMREDLQFATQQTREVYIR